MTDPIIYGFLLGFGLITGIALGVKFWALIENALYEWRNRDA